MNLLTLANAVANGIVVIAVVDMAIRVFGNSEHRIHSHPELLYMRKFVSSMVICGATLNLATLSTPSWTEVVLNYAFAGNYLFSCYYDRQTRTKYPTRSKKLSGKQSSGRSSSSRKTSSRSNASRNGRKRPTA